MDVNIFTAFAAGLASFFAPCTLATLPIFLTNIASSSGEDLITNKGKKRIVLQKVGWYIGGFTITFMLLGIGVAGISRFFISNQELFMQFCGMILVILAIFILFGHRFRKLSFLYAERKMQVDVAKLGFSGLTPFILGVANGFSWTPCIGPMLGSILVLASSNASLVTGLFMMLIYSIGISTPMIIFAAFFDFFAPKIKLLLKYGNKIYKAGAIIVLITGILLLLGWYDDVASWLFQFINLANCAS